MMQYTINRYLAKAVDSARRLPNAGAQNIFMADATLYAAGFVLRIDYIDDQRAKPKKTSVPVSLGSKTFNPTHLKQSIYAKKFSAHFAFASFAHIP